MRYVRKQCLDVFVCVLYLTLLDWNTVAVHQLAASELAEKMLHKALDIARAKRDVELEHSAAAEQTFADAMEEKLQDEAALHRLDGDVMGSVNQVGMVEGLDASYEDTERLRDLSVTHAASDEQMDWMSKVKTAENVAARAKEEFTTSERKLEELEQTEAELKAALKELHEAQNDLKMKQWQQQREE